MIPPLEKSRVILYEYPFNEKIRTYLRLEHLFARLFTLQERIDALDHHFALITLFEILNVGARPDLKTDVLKDLDRQRQTMLAYRGNPGIATDVLERLLAQLEECFVTLTNISGKLGHELNENDWLKSLRSRTSIPGGTCEFDLPAYYAWQKLGDRRRQDDLREWVSGLVPLFNGIHLLLSLLRDSGAPQKMVAMGGQFQQNLPQGRTFQLLRLSLDPNLGAIPEISANRLVASIRFVRHDADGKLYGNSADTPFDLTLCA
jgi:cell division protein ZapD